MVLNTGSVVVRNDNLLSTPLDSDLIVLNPSGNNYIGLDEIGRHIWDLLAMPRMAGHLCGQLASEYRGDSVQINADVMCLLEELVAEGLVHVVDPDIET